MSMNLIALAEAISSGSTRKTTAAAIAKAYNNLCAFKRHGFVNRHCKFSRKFNEGLADLTKLLGGRGFTTPPFYLRFDGAKKSVETTAKSHYNGLYATTRKSVDKFGDDLKEYTKKIDESDHANNIAQARADAVAEMSRNKPTFNHTTICKNFAVLATCIAIVDDRYGNESRITDFDTMKYATLYNIVTKIYDEYAHEGDEPDWDGDKVLSVIGTNTVSAVQKIFDEDLSQAEVDENPFTPDKEKEKPKDILANCNNPARPGGSPHHASRNNNGAGKIGFTAKTNNYPKQTDEEREPCTNCTEALKALGGNLQQNQRDMVQKQIKKHKGKDCLRFYAENGVWKMRVGEELKKAMDARKK